MWVETSPVSAVVTPSMVYVPATLTERSVNLILVVHVPSLVVLFPLVVVTGPVGELLAETITVLDAAQLKFSSQSWSGIEVGPNDAASVLVIVNEGAGAQPFSSEMTAFADDVKMSTQAVPPDGSRNAETIVSVQTSATQETRKAFKLVPAPRRVSRNWDHGGPDQQDQDQPGRLLLVSCQKPPCPWHGPGGQAMRPSVSAPSGR